MRRLFAAVIVFLAVLSAAPASATTTVAIPAKGLSGTWYFVDKTPACSNGGEAYECGWVWMVQISGKKIRSIWYSPQANSVGTNGWARVQDRRIKAQALDR